MSINDKATSGQEKENTHSKYQSSNITFITIDWTLPWKWKSVSKSYDQKEGG